MSREDWIWMPHPGHFIGGFECRFRLNTKVGNVIVSTVGEYLPNHQILEFVPIGINRKYETMVFKAVKSRHQCCPWEMVCPELDMDEYNDPESAFKGHMRLCKKWDEMKILEKKTVKKS